MQNAVIRLRVRKQTWEQRNDDRRMNVVLNKALTELLRVIGVRTTWLEQLSFVPHYNEPYKGIHYSPGITAALFGQLDPPQWGVDIYTPLAIQVHVTPTETPTHIEMQLHIDAACEEYILRTLALQPEEEVASNMPAEDDFDDQPRTGQRLQLGD